jgi:hypothetical protein
MSAESQQAWGDALARMRSLVDSQPDSLVYRADLARALVIEGDHRDAAVQAEKIATSPAATPSILLSAAEIYARAAAAPQSEQSSADPASADQAEAYAKRAIQILARLHEQGYFARYPHRLREVATGASFRALADREDFRALLASLDAVAK